MENKREATVFIQQQVIRAMEPVDYALPMQKGYSG